MLVMTCIQFDWTRNQINDDDDDDDDDGNDDDDDMMMMMMMMMMMVMVVVVVVVVVVMMMMMMMMMMITMMMMMIMMRYFYTTCKPKILKTNVTAKTKIYYDICFFFKSQQQPNKRSSFKSVMRSFWSILRSPRRLYCLRCILLRMVSPRVNWLFLCQMEWSGR